MSIKVKADLKKLQQLTQKLEALQKPIDQETAKKVGDVTLSIMLSLIAKGISPINKIGRFPGYLAQARKDKRGYPYSMMKQYPDKKVRPVNLWLSGNFLKSLTVVTSPTKTGYDTWIDFKSSGGAPAKGRKKPVDPALIEKGHREGANGQPKRPILPFLEQGEEFARTIIVEIGRIYRERIQRLLKS